MKNLLTATIILCAFAAQSQISDPLITSWKFNISGHHVISPSNDTILTDVESVYYNSANVFVKASGVPDYYRFGINVNDASDRQYVWKITRTPQAATGTHQSNLMGGQCGVIKDGSTFFNPEDARSYQNANVWHQLAYYFEINDFDSTWGHSSPVNEYHHHVLDLAYSDTANHGGHSALVGYAFDGFPVYGPYAYSDSSNASSTVIRMRPSWQKRNISQRTTLPDGTVLTASQYGPGLMGATPLGCYREDYEYVAGSGNLDRYNGRYGKTPEYPNGTYAYFMTIDSLNRPLYPNAVGQEFYGTVQQGNQGPQGGKNTIPGDAVKYSVVNGIAETPGFNYDLFPNPSNGLMTIKFDDSFEGTMEVADANGHVLLKEYLDGAAYRMNLNTLQAGVYFVRVSDAKTAAVALKRITKF